jgi:lysophospholipase L1-like esterase
MTYMERLPQSQYKSELNGLQVDNWLPYKSLCFIGDSITQTGLYARTLFEYAVSRYPERQRFFVNGGTAGDTAAMVLTRIERDILVRQPDAACIMLGMNDIGRHFYPEGPVTEELLSSRKRRLEEFGINLNEILGILKQKGIVPILVTPTPYDQDADLPATNFPGCNDALGQCVQIVAKLADSYNAGLINLWEPMNEINASIRLRDQTATLIGQDRVHPDARGHMVMAYLLLKQTGAANRLPRIQLNGPQPTEAYNCAIDHVGKDADGTIRLSYTSDRIPLFRDEAYRNADKLVPLTEDFNLEKITIAGLSSGNYECLIDEQSVGNYSSMELSEGINIAVIDGTSIQAKAAELYKLSGIKYGLESKLRSVMFTEQLMYGNGIDLHQPAVAEPYVRHLLSKETADPSWIKTQYTHYLESKPHESDIFAQIQAATEEMYRIASPFTRNLTFRPAND